jgi:putative transcriptional regulator
MLDQASEFVRSLRHELKMTQEEFAYELGITLGTVNRWENGHFRPSKLSRAVLLDFAQRHASSLHSLHHSAILHGAASFSPSVAAKPSDISS